ncbi:polyprenyl synthetase family protein [Anaerolineae bacterium CFX9]|jgi:geranylgeranyl pyrophosphate synthase|nr:polyprenyl synthetase family protein [Kamptonema cortianum]MDL1899540.1 polyprenyl synthetase family protein [Anaerolineae bacterium CFX9]
MTLQMANPVSLNATQNGSPAGHRDPIASGMEKVETLMHEVVKSDVTVLRDASHHILAAGGKRIRPRLTLLAYNAFGGEDFDSVAPLAAAVELVHTASVVHDDINDHGVVRRGRPSVNMIWGRTFALLTGDFLFTKVYELMAPHHDFNVVLAEATKALVEGETLQAAAVKENRFTREVYYDIIARKTAALFRAAAQMGAKAAGASDSEQEALAQFGFNVGLAFQIVDDVLDLIGDEAQLGKTSGIDLAQGRGFAAAYNDGEAGVFAEASADSSADPMIAIRQKVLQGNTVQEAYEQARGLVELALSQLEILPETEAKAALAALARSVVERTY